MSHMRALDVLAPTPMDLASMGVAFVAYFVVSFLWWGPIFGKTWSRLMGFDADEAPSMAKPILLQVLGSALLVYVLWAVMEAFVVAHEGAGLARGTLGIADALTGAFFTWLGFFVPVQLGRVAWERAPWSLFAINAGGHLVAIATASLVYALM